MNYIVVDFEWNQPQNKQSKIFENNGVRFLCEIMQIGAVKLSENLSIVGEFSATIKPKYYTKLHREVSRVTHLTSDDLADGRSFPEEYGRFADWCGDDFLFLSWGFEDIPILQQNTAFYEIPFRGDHHFINLHFCFYFNAGRDRAGFFLGYQYNFKLGISANTDT